MREFLEDVDQHRDDGVALARKHAKGELPKRFYRTAGAAPSPDGGFTVTLDGRPTRTPGRVPVLVPVAEIATRMAEEWAAQGDFIDPQTMPIVRLVNSALEGGEGAVSALRDEISSYAGNDLMLYRADSPAELVAEEEAVWDAALVKLARHFGLSFQPTIGIVHQPQPPSTLARLHDALVEENFFVLAALLSITGITGSGLLAIGLLHRLFTPDHVWIAAHVDEDHQMRLWGAVDEAVERRAKRRREFDAAVFVLEMLRPD